MPHQTSGAPMPPPYPGSTCCLDLARTRINAGRTLEEIADATKISVRFLKAIEAGEYDKLPGGIFSTSYLRQYAAAIGFDEAELLAHYDRKMNPVPRGVRRVNAPGSRGFLDRWLGSQAQAQH